MKERLDVLLVQRGLCESREKAKAVIMAGDVFVNNVREDKAGTKFDIYAPIEVRGNKSKYVSRGGYKLEKAIEAYGIQLEDKICMDVGSSTGGFTDCMLQNGAKKVYAVDVGTNQLSWKLRQDERVVSMEKTNVRYLTRDQIDDLVSFVSIDVAFISLTKVLSPVRELMENGGEMVCLVKPQFEAGKEKVGKKGVVRDKKVHEEVIYQVLSYALCNGFEYLNMDFSPIKGPEGNIEYLLHLKKSVTGGMDENVADEKTTGMDETVVDVDMAMYQKVIKETVERSHQSLDEGK
ncbi:MAG: TlyA family RNA methyltransferase [Lachnospiraceae bacterium]|nr:TlyA family RNA methyltransferase [Lachnospiraceae bacterium]